jgi:VIT1/CCC1 family predicted Fe2+/Mn2+ transporter
LFGALGCNLAWGLIDAIFYLLACLSQRGHGIKLMQALRTTTDADLAHSIIADALPPALASVLSPEDLEAMRQKLTRLPQLPTRLWLPKDDWLGALSVFLLVMLSTFPVVIPFIFIKEASLALLVSNGIAIVLLFLTGYAYGRYAWHYPWRTGIVMVILGVALVGITKALGG